jgi:hypothetical protein
MPDHQFVDVLRTMVDAAAPALFAGAPPRVTLRLGAATTTLNSSPSASAEAACVLTGSGTVEVVLAGPEEVVVPARDVAIAVLTCEHDRLLGAVASEVVEGEYSIVQRYTALSLTSVTTHAEPSREPGVLDVVSCRLTLRTQTRIEIRGATQGPSSRRVTRDDGAAGAGASRR